MSLSVGHSRPLTFSMYTRKVPMSNVSNRRSPIQKSKSPAKSNKKFVFVEIQVQKSETFLQMFLQDVWLVRAYKCSLGRESLHPGIPLSVKEWESFRRASLTLCQFSSSSLFSFIRMFFFLSSVGFLALQDVFSLKSR
jgi:hypothetical protein